MKNTLHAVCLLLLLPAIAACTGKRGNQTLNERYRMPWREANHKEFVALGETIAKRGIRLCDQYYIREASSAPGEYLVGCTADGNTWTYYVVNAVIREVAGPIQDSTLVSPR